MRVREGKRARERGVGRKIASREGRAVRKKQNSVISVTNHVQTQDTPLQLYSRSGLETVGNVKVIVMLPTWGWVGNWVSIGVLSGPRHFGVRKSMHEPCKLRICRE